MCKIANAEFGCRYRPVYTYNRCNRFAIENGLCAQHLEEKCISCGGQATHECSYSGQFVCGYPLCDDCEGRNEQGPSGAWGFLNHVHKPKPVEKRKHEIREAIAADFGIEKQTLERKS